jgi:hypothetical protein
LLSFYFLNRRRRKCFLKKIYEKLVVVTVELWKTAHVFGDCGKSVNKHAFPFINAFSTGGERGFPQFHSLVLEYLITI